MTPQLRALSVHLFTATGAVFAMLAMLAAVDGKWNLTGSPGLKLQGRPLGLTHYTHPNLVGVVCSLLDKAGARRVRLVESAWATGGPLEEYMLDAGWSVRSLKRAAKLIEMENTNALGAGKRYAELKVPDGGYVFPSFRLNQAYEDTDVFMTIAKLKNHATCGVTMALKNSFGITPASIYGGDAGVDEPNESPTQGREIGRASCRERV